MKRWTHIIIHHSLTSDGQTVNWQAIRSWHTGQHPQSPYQGDKAWRDIGYHWGVELVNKEYEVLMGRPMDQDGAHTLGMNDRGIGICCVGNYDVEMPPQGMLDKLVQLCSWLTKVYLIPVKNIDGHRAYSHKTCPGMKFNIDLLRSMVEVYK